MNIDRLLLTEAKRDSSLYNIDQSFLYECYRINKEFANDINEIYTHFERQILLEETNKDLLLKNLIDEASLGDYWNKAKGAVQGAVKGWQSSTPAAKPPILKPPVLAPNKPPVLKPTSAPDLSSIETEIGTILSQLKSADTNKQLNLGTEFGGIPVATPQQKGVIRRTIEKSIEAAVTKFITGIGNAAKATKTAVQNPKQTIDALIAKLTPNLSIPDDKKGLEAFRTLIINNPGYTNFGIGILVNISKIAGGGLVGGAVTGLLLRTALGHFKGEPIGTAFKKAMIVTGTSMAIGSVLKGLMSMLGGHGFIHGIEKYFGGGQATEAAATIAGTPEGIISTSLGEIDINAEEAVILPGNPLAKIVGEYIKNNKGHYVNYDGLFKYITEKTGISNQALNVAMDANDKSDHINAALYMMSMNSDQDLTPQINSVTGNLLSGIKDTIKTHPDYAKNFMGHMAGQAADTTTGHAADAAQQQAPPVTAQGQAPPGQVQGQSAPAVPSQHPPEPIDTETQSEVPSNQRLQIGDSTFKDKRVAYLYEKQIANHSFNPDKFQNDPKLWQALKKNQPGYSFFNNNGQINLGILNNGGTVAPAVHMATHTISIELHTDNSNLMRTILNKAVEASRQGINADNAIKLAGEGKYSEAINILKQAGVNVSDIKPPIRMDYIRQIEDGLEKLGMTPVNQGNGMARPDVTGIVEAFKNKDFATGFKAMDYLSKLAGIQTPVSPEVRQGLLSGTAIQESAYKSYMKKLI